MSLVNLISSLAGPAIGLWFKPFQLPPFTLHTSTSLYFNWSTINLQDASILL